MPSPKNNLVSLFNKVFDGTGHKKLPKVNRAHSWMRNHSLDGPCLTFLNNYITEDNFITVEQMNMFKKLEAEGDLPAESEIDTLLAEYLGETFVDLASIHPSSLQKQLSQAEKYHAALDGQERMLRRHCNKLQEEIRTKSAETSIPESPSSISVNGAYNEAWKQVQSSLSNVLENFSVLLTDNGNLNEYLMPEPFLEKINIFHNTIEERFFGLEVPLEVDNYLEVATKRVDPVDEQSRNAVSVTEHLGQLDYQRAKLQCEEAEFMEMDRFITETSEKVDVYTTHAAHLSSLCNLGLQETDILQQKIVKLSESSENCLKVLASVRMLVAHRQRVQQNLESVNEHMNDVKDFCIKYIDLVTLLACLARAKEWKIESLLLLVDIVRQKLDEHEKQHSSAVMKLTKLESGEAAERGVDIILNASSCPENEEEDRIIPFVSNYLRTFCAVKQKLDELEGLIFNGPVRSELFFSRTLRNDETLVRQQCDRFKTQIELWDAQSGKIKREEEQLDEITKSFKTLGLMFLANPDGYVLRSKLKQLRDMGSRTITIVSGTNNYSLSNSHGMDAEKGVILE